MTPISMRSHECERAPVASAIPSFALLACLCLTAPPAWSSLLAGDEKPPAATDQAGHAGEQEEKKNDQAGKPARESQEEAKAASQPKPTPTPRAGKAPKAATASAPQAGTITKPASPTSPPEPVMKFTDFDLEKYHRPVPQEDEEAGTDSAGGVAPAGGRPAQRPRGMSKPPPEDPGLDPLKPFKDREAKEKFRQMQIETGRQRIAKLQERLDYLNAKHDALTNPAPLLAGQTQVQNPPEKPGDPPPPPTPIQGPGRGITAKAGTGKTPVMGLFPPIPPPQTDEDKENDKRLKVKDLLKQVEDEIKSVEEEIETARGELASVETRFAQESQSR